MYNFLDRKSVASIRNYVSGIKLLHLFLDLDCPQFGSFELKLVLRGLQRLNPHCPKRALPILPDILLEFLQFLDLGDPAQASFWCLFLLAFFLMARKSNLVPLLRRVLTQENSCAEKI